MPQAGAVVERHGRVICETSETYLPFTKGLGLGLNPPPITEILLAALYLLQHFDLARSKTEDKEGRECLCKFYLHIVENRLQQNLDRSHRESIRHQKAVEYSLG